MMVQLCVYSRHGWTNARVFLWKWNQWPCIVSFQTVVMSIVILFLSCIKEWINNGDADGLVRYASPVHLQLTHWAIPNHASLFSSYQWVNSAIDDSDFISNLTASLHLQVPRHLTTVKLMTEKQDNFVLLACDSVLHIGWRHQKWLTRVGKMSLPFEWFAGNRSISQMLEPCRWLVAN